MSTINPGRYNTQIDDIALILKKINILEYRNYSPHYPKDAASEFRNLSYDDVWEKCFKEQYYDFQLIDNSIIKFNISSFDPLKLSYLYYDCPYDCITYELYLADNGLNYCEVGDELRFEYEQYLTTCQRKRCIVPIRYDIDFNSYNPDIHPASHIHIGFKNSIRISTQKLLKPISFALFIIRQCYPDAWKMLLSKEKKVSIWRNIRDDLELISSQYYCDIDRKEMLLS